MTQTTRFIDITRTFIPTDPNSFPDGLHQRESVEERIPVMAYMGQNFLPTSYGYKSYFGIAQRLGIDQLQERVDHIFIFQNNSLENILIALCDSGIWYKAASTAGAWTKVYTTPDNRGTTMYYPWTYAIINDNLYVYRQNWPTYQKITSQAASPGFALTDVTPNFLNMEAQLGVFRAGSRLGFWDSADSIAWSNLDNFEDFTPSIETLAGSATFSDVVGRIVTIKSHGEGFMIYATQSIVWVAEAPEALFQWDPKRILSGGGIAYSREVTVSVPDTTHYAYTNIGLYQIKNAQAEIIVPEVTDFFKKAAGPKYLKMLEGRYLMFQSLDANFVTGRPLYSDELIPDTIIKLPGSNLVLQDEVADAQTQGGAAFCPILDGLGNGAYSQPPAPAPGKFYRPVYTAYLSGVGDISTDVEWDTVPCSVVNLATSEAYAMTPKSHPATFDKVSTDTSHKTPVAGTSAYIDGRWTIERFVQVQSAIWQKQQNQLSELMSQILSRSHTSQKQTESASEVTSFSQSRCELGKYILAFSGPQFGFSKCEFWLTRFITSAAQLNVVKTNRKTSQAVAEQVIPPTLAGWAMQVSFAYKDPECTSLYGDPTAAYQACCAAVNGGGCTLGGGGYTISSYAYGGKPLIAQFGNGYTAVATYSCPPGFTLSNPKGGCYKAAHWLVTEQNTAYIEAVPVSIGPTPETAVCKLTGWEDTDTNMITPSGSCTEPPVVGGPTGVGNKPANLGKDGSFCSKPFEPITIEGTPAVVITWPEEVITIPGGTFFLQNGSGEPLYPTFEGAYVYDTHLKKWGKYKGRHKQLLDYLPINTYAPSSQSYERFGIMGGILTEGGYLHLFDAYPQDAWITYGKMGYYRQGTTSVEELNIHMAIPVDCTVTVDTSLTGKNLTTGFSKTESYTQQDNIRFCGGYNGRWHNVTIAGQFDISFIEYRGNPKGKR